MADYLSSQWIEQIDEAASSSEALRSATADVALTVQQEVTGGPEGDVTFHVVADHGDVSVRRGAAEHPDVTFTQDHATATAIGRGDLSAQAAFMVGRLRVAGDLDRLLTQHEAFIGIDDVFDEVRARTTWPAGHGVTDA